jgi:hypothetical protein
LEVNTGMNDMRFFPRPSSVRLVIAIIIVLAVIAILAVASLSVARTIPAPADTDGFWRSFTLSFLRSGLNSMGGGLIVGSIVAVIGVLYLRAVVNKRPMVIVDEERLRLPRHGIALRWEGIKSFTRSRLFWTPVIGISTVNDDGLVRAVPFVLKLIYRIRIRGCGGPFAIPPVKEASLDELYTMLEERRQAAIAKSA